MKMGNNHMQMQNITSMAEVMSPIQLDTACLVARIEVNIECYPKHQYKQSWDYLSETYSSLKLGS